MEFHQLRYFVAVVETGSFGRAADRCHVSQPALSQQIAKLERELGDQLFDRLGRKIAVTELGQSFYPRAKRIVIDVDGMRDAVIEDVQLGRGKVAVGAIPTIAPYLMPGTLLGFRSEFPEARLELCEDTTANLSAMVLNTELDVAFMSLPLEHSALEYEEIARESFVVVAASSSALAERKRIPWSELDDLPMIVLHEMHCVSGQVNSICMERGVRQQVVCRSAQLTTLLHMVSLDLGVSVVPKSCIASEPGRGVTPLRLTGESPDRAIVAVWNGSRARPRLAQAIVEHARAACAASDDFIT